MEPPSKLLPSNTLSTAPPSQPAAPKRPNFKLRKSIQPRPLLGVLNELGGHNKPSFEFLDVPEVERERRAWQGDMPVEEVGSFECRCVVGELEWIAEGHSKPEAKAVVAEMAVQGLIAQRCELNESEGVGNSEDNCPWAAIASLALHKLYTDWQAQGYTVPPELTSPPDSHLLLEHSSSSSSSSSSAPLPLTDTDKNPLQLLNEMAARMKAPLDFHLTGEVGAPNDKVFTMLLTLGTCTFSGQGKNKKAAKHAAAGAAVAAQAQWYVPPAPREEEWGEAEGGGGGATGQAALDGGQVAGLLPSQLKLQPAGKEKKVWTDFVKLIVFVPNIFD